MEENLKLFSDELTPNFNYILSKQSYMSLLKSMYFYKRSYHTLEHVKTMLQELDKLLQEGVKVQSLDAFCVAILFHDVYQYTKQDVMNSAILAYDLLTADTNIENLDIDYVVKLIQATNHSKERPLDEEEKLIHDLDLSVLSYGKKKYKKYSSQIRSEVFDNGMIHLYVAGRRNFLQKFLDREKIYLTSYFDEETARRNLQRELDDLNKALGGWRY